jgi:hypothetical protein
MNFIKHDNKNIHDDYFNSHDASLSEGIGSQGG